MSRLCELYKGEVAPALMKKFSYKSPMQIPRVDKIVINVGCGDAKENSKVIDSVIEEISQRNGLVIATGGGAVLRDENVNALSRNGRICFLDRPLEALLPTEDRPLANDAEKIRKLYEQRYSRYCSVADLRIDAKASAEKVAEQIGKDYEA